MLTSRLAPILVLLAVALPVSTAGAQTTGAPGNSGVDQYRESVPSGGGKKKPVDRKTRDALDRQGSDGRALAASLENNGGVPVAAAGGSGGGSGSDGGSGSGGGASAGGSGSASGSGSGSGGASSGSGSGGTASSGSAAGSATTGDEAAAQAASDAPVAAASSSAFDAKVGPVPVWVLMIVVLASALGAVLVRRGRAA